MKNLKEISEKYKDVGLGHIRWGGKKYYEINSDKEISLNSYGGSAGFVLNDAEQVQTYYFTDAPYLYYKGKEEITSDEYYALLADIDDDLEKEVALDLSFESVSTILEWGLTLDNYYPYPWYPEREITAFELMMDIPFHRKGIILNVSETGMLIDAVYNFSLALCLELAEYFKPIYK